MLVYRQAHPALQLFRNLFILICNYFSCFCLLRKLLKVAGHTFDSLLGIIVLFPAGFLLSEKPLLLLPQFHSYFFSLHIIAALTACVFIVKAAAAALGQVIGIKYRQANLIGFEESAYRISCAGFPLLTLGLVLGCLWTQFAWADWWGWNPEQMWSLAAWLVFAGYFFYRSAFGVKFARLNSLWILTSFALIIINLLWPNLAGFFLV